MKQKKNISPVTEFVAVPICYVVSAVLLLLLALLIFLYFSSKGPEVPQPSLGSQQPINQAPKKREPPITIKEAVKEPCGGALGNTT